MAKPKGVNQKAKWRAHSIRLAKYADRVQSVYDTLNKEIASIVLRTGYDGSQPFRFSDYPATKRKFDELRAQFVEDMRSVIYSGTSEEWKQSNLVQDLLADKALKFYGVKRNGKKARVYYQTNSDALKAFQRRKDKGLNLSQKLWNQSKDYKVEMEHCISSAVEKGTSAVKLSKRLSKYLEDYPSLKKDYKEKFGKAVKCQDCEYRSIRLARSEINMAYRTAEQERWKQFDFVLGYEVRLTQNGRHKQDICDDLAGKYPKDFAFVGWHPNCMCYVIPLLKSEEEFWGDKEVEPIEEVPRNFKDWVSKNVNRIKEAEVNDALPFFLKENPEFRKYMGVEAVAEYRHRTRDEQIIRIAAKNRQRMLESGDNYVLNSIRKNAHYIDFDITELEELIRTTDLKYDKYGTSKIFDDAVDRVKQDLILSREAINSSYEKLQLLSRNIKNSVGAYRTEGALDIIDGAVSGFDKFSTEQGVVFKKADFDRAYRLALKKHKENIKRLDGSNVADIENALGIKKSHPMSFKEADEGRGNIMYKARVGNQYSINCQVCVIADEMRRRGFNVTALGRVKGTGVPDKVAYCTELPWKVKGTGAIPKKEYVSMLGKSDKEIFIDLDKATKAKGRYHINFGWANAKEGHIVCLERRANGTLRYYDPQTGIQYDIMDWIAKMDRQYIGVLKVDDLLLDANILPYMVRPL